ncbi:MAG: hypothetical protein R3F43_18745 [bacterium]
MSPGPAPSRCTLRSPWPDLVGAFSGVASLLGGEDEGRTVWLLLVVETAVTEVTPAAIQALQGLVDLGAGVDIICTHPAADMGLLSRLAQRTGGELIQASAAEIVERMVRRVGLLRISARAGRASMCGRRGGAHPARLPGDPTPAFVGLLPASADACCCCPSGSSPPRPRPPG